MEGYRHQRPTAVAGTGTFTGCASLLDPAITSGTISISGDGVDDAGLFEPADETEVATGTQDTNLPGIGKGFDMHFTAVSFAVVG